VAIIGASDDIRKWGGSALRNLLDGGYKGTIYPVNPRGGTFFGIPAYPSLASLPDAPDLALMAVGGRQVHSVLEECGDRCVRAVVVLAAGFSETGAEGASLEREMVEIANARHITLIGPNCIGLLSNEASFHATGFLALHPPQGRLSFVSQSGSLASGVAVTAERQGVGMEKFITVGNEAQVSAFDVLDYLRDDPHTQGVMMYLEGIDDGRHFLEAARKTTVTKPVVVLRGGITESGGRAAASHTGAMAGSAAVYQAAARQAGVVTCRNVPDMVDMGTCLTYLPLPRGRRVAVVTNGGGPGVMAADEAALSGLQLADVPAELIAAIDRLLPPFWSRRNPLDLVAMAYGDTGLQVMDLVARCDTVDAIVAFGFIAVPTASDDREKLVCGEFNGFSPWEVSWLERITQLMEETGKPIIPVPAGPIYAHGLSLAPGGRYRPVLLASAGAAMRALDRMEWYRGYVEGAR
jgi:acyl-CoA synthetase (NDP forming)